MAQGVFSQFFMLNCPYFLAADRQPKKYAFIGMLLLKRIQRSTARVDNISKRPIVSTIKSM
jgi:hypothetical protein